MTIKQVFIANLKKYRKIRGLSQMALADLCDIGYNYIGHIEMGRRIPSFEKIEKIASVLEIPYSALFVAETTEKEMVKKVEIDEYLKKMPAPIRRKLVARMTSAIKKGIEASLNP